MVKKIFAQAYLWILLLLLYPLWWHAPSAVLCICLTECARSAVPTTAAKSRSSSLWQRTSKFLCVHAGGKRSFPPAFLRVLSPTPPV